MAIDFSTVSSALHDHRLKQQRLVFQVAIDANGTPADKGHDSDIPGVAVLRTEGKTAEADAIEDISGDVTAPVDATGIFGMLVDVRATKLYSVTVTPSVGAVTVTSVKKSSGRLAIDMDSDQDLSSQDLTLTVEIEYKQ